MSSTMEMREMQTRERSQRPVYEEYNPLKIPDSVKNLFDSQNLELMWARYMIKGEEDWMNLRKKEEFGWTPVGRDEAPELAAPVGSMATVGERFRDCIIRGDLLLMKCPRELVEARKEHFEGKARAQLDAVNQQLMHNNDPRMPVTNSSRAQVHRGRPSFDE